MNLKDNFFNFYNKINLIISGNGIIKTKFFKEFQQFSVRKINDKNPVIKIVISDKIKIKSNNTNFLWKKHHVSYYSESILFSNKLSKSSIQISKNNNNNTDLIFYNSNDYFFARDIIEYIIRLYFINSNIVQLHGAAYSSNERAFIKIGAAKTGKTEWVVKKTINNYSNNFISDDRLYIDLQSYVYPNWRYITINRPSIHILLFGKNFKYILWNMSNKFSNNMFFKKISNCFENRPVKIYANEIRNKENRILKIKKTVESKEITADMIINISKEEWNNSLKELFDNFKNDNIWKREFINLINKENSIISSVF
jgi:hypothetical protein